MSTTAMTPAEIVAAVEAYNAEWLATEATDEETAAFAAALANGTPTRMVNVDRERSPRTGAYRLTVTHGIRVPGPGATGSFYCAEDPTVGSIRPRNIRGRIVQLPAALAQTRFRRALPRGVELVVKAR